MQRDVSRRRARQPLLKRVRRGCIFFSKRIPAGSCIRQTNMVDSAASDLELAVQQERDHTQMYYDFGHVIERRGDKKRRCDPDSALAQYDGTRDLAPDSPEYRGDYGGLPEDWECIDSSPPLRSIYFLSLFRLLAPFRILWRSSALSSCRSWPSGTPAFRRR